MVNEIVYTAKSQNKTSKSVFLGLLGTSMILVLLAMMLPKYTGIVWMVALGFITATIYVYNRFVGSEYRYAINNDGGRPSFTVGMQVGKTSRTMARVDLSSIVEVKRMSRAEYRSHKCDKGVMKYPYFPTMFAEEVYLVVIRSEYEQADIFIEAAAEFISALESYVVRTEE
jgi:hypothetical protein